MLLASVTEIVQALGFDAMTDITNATTMALDAAEAQLSGMFDTDFAQGSYVDTFFVREPPYMDGPAVSTEFRLNQGFLTSTSSIVMAGSMADLNGGNATDISSAFSWNPDDQGRGVIKDFTTRYRRQFVRVTYSCGFPVSGSDPTSYDLTVVPDWLQQAAKINALIGLAGSPALSEASVKLDVTTLTRQYNALTARKARYAPMALLPL